MPFSLSLPSPSTPPMRSVSYRSPLTPSTVTPPSVSTANSNVTKNDLGTSPTKASSILGRLASSPSSRQPSQAPTSVPPSPEERQKPMLDRPALDRRHTTPVLSEEKRCWKDFRQQDGYVSFPDFEYYYPDSQREDSHLECRERLAVTT